MAEFRQALLFWDVKKKLALVLLEPVSRISEKPICSAAHTRIATPCEVGRPDGSETVDFTHGYTDEINGKDIGLDCDNAAEAPILPRRSWACASSWFR